MKAFFVAFIALVIVSQVLAQTTATTGNGISVGSNGINLNGDDNTVNADKNGLTAGNDEGSITVDKNGVHINKNNGTTNDNNDNSAAYTNTVGVIFSALTVALSCYFCL